jgi:glutamate-5-semialdehyde dehydrogenase
MANQLREVSALADPVGAILNTWTRPNGLLIGQMRVPMGVVGVIYESRPNVTSDSAALCIKSGNAVILRGGSDAINSNIIIGEVLRDALSGTGVPTDAIQVVSTVDRAAAEELMSMRQYIDVLVPRGGADLINTVIEKSRIPVIETGTGNCHVYVNEDADQEEALMIVLNAKVQRPGVCNAAEKLIVDRKIASDFIPKIIRMLREKNVEDAATKRLSN